MTPRVIEARLGERGEKRIADRGEALVGEDLDLSRVAEIGHVAFTLSVEPTGVLEHAGGRSSLVAQVAFS